MEEKYRFATDFWHQVIKTVRIQLNFQQSVKENFKSNLLQGRIVCSKLFDAIGVAKRVQRMLARAQTGGDHRNLICHLKNNKKITSVLSLSVL